MRAIASEPRRSFAIRALPLPDSIVQVGKLGGSFRLYGGRPVLRRILSSFFTACPRSQLGRPQLTKFAIAPLPTFLSKLPSSICCSKLAARLRSRISLYFNDLNKLPW